MPKNLLFVFADQWRRQAVGFAKQDEIFTPHMDGFAASAVWCDNAVSSFPLCSPHRASLFSGRRLQSHGVFTNCKTGLSMRLSDSERCIAQPLREAGYQTGYIGKWHLDEPEVNHSQAPLSGAKNWDAYTPEGAARHGFEFWHSYGANDEHLTPHYWENGEKQIPVNKWSPEHETDIALQFIENRSKEKPFCLFVSWNPPHSPYELVPEKHLKRYEAREIQLRKNISLDQIHHHTGEPANYSEQELKQVTRQYYAAVSGLDEQFGRLLASLKAQGLAEDTIVVLSADHGDMLGSHGLLAKHVWYEESIGIPFIIGGAGLKASRCGTVFGSADIAPTLLELLDTAVPREMQGESVAKDLINGNTDKERYTIIEACPGRDVFLKEFSQACKNPMHYGWRGLRTFTHTYVVNAGYSPCDATPLQRILYDNLADPYQQSPIHMKKAAENKTAQKLEEVLKQELLKENDGFLQHFEKE